jgi:broad specificity phosphatase PhoE
MDEARGVNLEIARNLEVKKPSLDAIFIFGQGPVLKKETRIRANRNNTGITDETDINMWAKTLATSAFELYKRGQTREFIVLGGRTGGEAYLSEADKIAGEMAKCGVPKEVIKLEQRSSNTLENIANVLNDYADSTDEYEKVGLLGSDFHIPRIKLISQMFGIPYKEAFSAEEVMRYAAREKEPWDNSTLAEIERRLDMTPLPNKYYLDKIGEEKRNISRRGMEEDVYSRALLSVPENWLMYVGRLNDTERMMRILGKQDRRMLKTKFDIDLFVDSPDDVRQKLKTIKRIVLHPDKWGNKKWGKNVHRKLNAYIEERQGTPEKYKDTNIVLLRHAPTTYNKEGRIQGNVQTELVESEIIPYFEKMGVKNLSKPDLIVTSNLIRTIKTAEALKEYLNWGENVKIVEDPIFKEREWGIVLEGKTHEGARAELLKSEEMVKKYPNLATCKLEDVWDDDRDFKASSEAESLNEVWKRTTRGLIELQNKYPGKNILFITHAGVLVSQGLGWNQMASVTLKKDKITNKVSLEKINNGK